MQFRLGASALLLASFLPAVCLGQLQPQSNVTGNPADVLAAFPKCAVPCMITAVEASTCPPTDLNCICHSESISLNVTACVQASCTIVDALMAQNTTSVACDWPIRNRSKIYGDTSLSLGIIAVVFVLVRLYFKYFVSDARALGPDDKIIMFILGLRISCIVIDAYGINGKGSGQDVWKLPPHQITEYVYFLYIMNILYVAELAIIKLSLNVFYLQIFPASGIRRLLWATVFLNIGFGVAFVFAAIFQCTPVPYYWIQYTGTATGHCINISAFGWSIAACSLAVDIWMLALPLSQIPKLHLHWKKKIGVAVMFIMGTFVTIVSILRLRSVVEFGVSLNATWDQFDVILWSTVEVNVAIICTCLPTLRMILLRYAPKVFSSEFTKSSGSSGSDQYKSNKVSNNDSHHLADLESSADHTWTRLGKGHHVTRISAGKDLY